MGLLTFGLNVTLDGCYDHREMIADDELHDYFTQLIGGAGAMLYGRTTYEMIDSLIRLSVDAPESAGKRSDRCRPVHARH